MKKSLTSFPLALSVIFLILSGLWKANLYFCPSLISHPYPASFSPNYMMTLQPSLSSLKRSQSRPLLAKPVIKFNFISDKAYDFKLSKIPCSVESYKSLIALPSTNLNYSHSSSNQFLFYNTMDKKQWDLETASKSGLKYSINEAYFLLGSIDYVAKKSSHTNEILNMKDSLSISGFHFELGMGLNF
jgi:hypothetical protein